jgi:uncharacterized protein (TIGR03083 family)
MTDLLPAIARQRRALADLLDGFTDEQWNHQSLCQRWTNRHVAAHVSMGFNVSMPSFMIRMIKAKGNFDAAADTYARAEATKPTSEIVDCLRRNAEHRFKPPGNGFEAPLTDITIHTLDICRPLGLSAPIDPANWPTILEFLTTKKTQKFFKANHDNLHFTPTDINWSTGHGPTVSGPADDIALALAKRNIDLDTLTGDGLTTLTQRRA